MNERSSRSHAVFMLSLLQKGSDGHGARVSQLFLVDLAGSERVKKSRVVGEGLDQAVAINKSLHALGNASLFAISLFAMSCLYAVSLSNAISLFAPCCRATAKRRRSAQAT